jgi:hypothetical protein
MTARTVAPERVGTPALAFALVTLLCACGGGGRPAANGSLPAALGAARGVALTPGTI